MFERGKTNMNRRYRKTIIAGNWKMNKTPAEAKALIEEMKPLLSKTKWCEMVLCVPFTDIQAAVKAAKAPRLQSVPRTCTSRVRRFHRRDLR